MLSFHINWDDLGKPWSKSQGCWFFGTSFIAPFNNPAIEAFLVTDTNRRLLVAREQLRNSSLFEHDTENEYLEIKVSPNNYDEILNNAIEWPLEFIAIELSISPELNNYKIEVQTGEWGTAPIYILSSKNYIIGNWDITKLYDYVDSILLDPVEITRFLGCTTQYSSKTIFKDIKVLTERSKAIFSRGSFHINYPESAVINTPHILRENAEVTNCYREILSASLNRWFSVDGDGTFAYELSGGLDSACVVGVAKSVSKQSIATYGMLIDGDIGEQQQYRRQEIIRKFNTLDNTINAIEYPPLLASGSRIGQRRLSPYDEPYSEALKAMLSIAISNNHQIIFTGIGGDELVLPDSFDIDVCRDLNKQNLALHKTLLTFSHCMTDMAREIYLYSGMDNDLRDFPTTRISASALKAAKCRAPVFLRNGIWPINPLFTPELVSYCHKLPVQWRAKKYLHRKLLLELGLSSETVNPRLRENFSGIMKHSILNTFQPLLKKILDDSILSQMGIINIDKLSDEYEKYTNRKSDCNPTFFYNFIILELSIKSMYNRIV